MSDLPLEPARRSDAPRIASMARRFVEAGLEPCWTVPRIERHLRHDESVVLVARARDGLAGCAIMQFGEDTAHLNLLAVDPARRRAGVGRALVLWLEASARVAGTFAVRLELRAGNAGARAFYAALGYRETGRLRGYYQGLEDALRMERDLAEVRPAPTR